MSAAGSTGGAASSLCVGRFLRFAEADVPEAREISEQGLCHRLQIVEYAALLS
jgi:hypothetical protein